MTMNKFNEMLQSLTAFLPESLYVEAQALIMAPGFVSLMTMLILGWLILWLRARL